MTTPNADGDGRVNRFLYWLVEAVIYRVILLFIVAAIVVAIIEGARRVAAWLS